MTGLTSVVALAQFGLTIGFPALPSWRQENLAWSSPSGMDFSDSLWFFFALPIGCVVLCYVALYFQGFLWMRGWPVCWLLLGLGWWQISCSVQLMTGESRLVFPRNGFPDSLCFFALLIGCVVLCCLVLSGISVNEVLTSVLALARLGLTTGFPALSNWQENLAWHSLRNGFSWWVLLFCTVEKKTVCGLYWYAGHCNQVDVIPVWSDPGEYCTWRFCGLVLNSEIMGLLDFTGLEFCWSWRPARMCLCAFRLTFSWRYWECV